MILPHLVFPGWCINTFKKTGPNHRDFDIQREREPR